MDSDLESELRERGVELRARHDDDVIADVIGEIKSLEDENSEITAKILETMVDFD